MSPRFRRAALSFLVSCLLLGQGPETTPSNDNRALRPQQESPALPLAGERCVALVIGNGAYRNAPLKNPVNDAQAVAAILRECGFQVDLVLDADRTGMFQAVREFGQKLNGGGVGLFYFAGHGMAVKGANYLIPVAADIASEDEVEIQALSVQAVLNKMEVAQNRLNLLILDACRNNPFGRSFRSGSQGLAQMDAPAGSFIAYATAPGSTASDGEGANGLYTQHLLQALKQPSLNVEQVFKRVRVGVKRDSKDRQVPWDSSSLTGEFYFRPGIAPAPSAALPPALGPPGRTVDDWMRYQTEMDQAMEPLKALLGQKDLNALDKLKALEEANGKWAENNPYSDEDEAERAWIVDQALEIRIAQSRSAATQAKKTLNAGGFASWRIEERKKLTPWLAGSGKGEKHLKWLETGKGDGLGEGTALGEVMRDGGSGLAFAWVPPGTFTMGSADGLESEKPMHPVTISHGFWMGKSEVTVGQFRRFVEQTGYHTEAEQGDGALVWTGVWMKNGDANWRNPYLTQGEEHPVTCVSWNDAQAFVQWLNGKGGGAYRLPTEAEWEYACRAGTTGNMDEALESIAWHDRNSGKTTHPVGQKQPNAWGLHDTLGNVWEWCQDGYDESYYETSPSTDPQGPSLSQFRVLRGGGWNSFASSCRAATRNRDNPDNRSANEGFRIVVVPRTP